VSATTTPPPAAAPEDEVLGPDSWLTAAEPAGDPGSPPEAGGAGPDEVDQRAVLLTCVAALLAGASAGWMAAGVFGGGAARAVAVLGAAAGAFLVALSYRTPRPATVQYLALPAAVLVAGAVVVVDSGTSADLVRLVTDALFSGGIGQPPVPFDPGWRFLLTLLTMLLTSGAAAVAIGYARPNLAVALPVPLVFATALVQPAEVETVSTVVAFVLVIAGLAVAYGVELAASGVSSGRFELTRLLRGAGALAVLAVGLVVLANAASFLLPEARDEQVVPPQRPPAAPPQPDRPLFAVETDRPLPWRLGVLDVYEDGAWKTPPFDPARFVELPASADDIPGETGSTEETVTVTFSTEEIGGRTLPTLAGPHEIVLESGSGAIEFDPRTQTLRWGERIPEGVTYRIVASTPPTTEELSSAPPPGPEMDPFLEVPAPPPAVRELLAGAPTTNHFERLQFVRQAFYERVLAAGAGEPVDVPPARVEEILDGQEATPYEITAAEALLARWAGVPSRLGFGYFGGEPLEDGRLEVRPKHGSTYLEVWFEGEGWTPIVGKPPRAKSSFTDAEKNEDPAVRPTDELALITYVPVRLESITLLFEVVRFYLLQLLPVALALVLAIAFYPGLLRLLRRVRRSRWARTHGPAGRIVVAYSELRDLAWDLNIGQQSDTPLEFVEALAPDDEHGELAWLVTRGLWGDLRRDLGEDDAALAEEMAASVARRLRGAQTLVTRILAVSSRASLREPWSDELPNAWWRPRLRERVRRIVRPARRALAQAVGSLDPRRLRRRPTGRAATTVLPFLVLALSLFGCAEPLDLRAAADPSTLPDPAVPTSIDDIEFQREPTAETAFEEGGDAALVTTGQVWSVRRDDAIEASLQIAAVRPGLVGRADEVRRGILSSLGGGRFEPIRLGEERVYVLESVEQRMLLWFAPDGSYYELLVARKSFDDAVPLFEALLAFQRGADVAGLDDIRRVEPPDPRRGFPT
jgi:hypothetical protein